MQAVVVMLVISALVFVGVYAVGNPIDVMISPDVTQEIREQTIRAYGFDLPLWQQYGIFLQRLFTGDFGRSFVYNMPVLDLILSRLPATLEQALDAFEADPLSEAVMGRKMASAWLDSGGRWIRTGSAARAFCASVWVPCTCWPRTPRAD